MVTHQTLGSFCPVLQCDSVVFSPAGPEMWAKPPSDAGAQSFPPLLFASHFLCPSATKSDFSVRLNVHIWLLWVSRVCERKLVVNLCDWYSSQCWKAPDLPSRMFAVLQHTGISLALRQWYRLILSHRDDTHTYFNYSVWFCVCFLPEWPILVIKHLTPSCLGEGRADLSDIPQSVHVRSNMSAVWQLASDVTAEPHSPLFLCVRKKVSRHG